MAFSAVKRQASRNRGTSRKYMSLYKKILGESWKITWRNKYLWFFGLFVAFLEVGGEYNTLLRYLFRGSAEGGLPFWNRLVDVGVFSDQAIRNIGQQEPLAVLSLLFVFLVIIALICFIVWLTAVSQAGLVNNSSYYLTGKKYTKDDFKIGIKSGTKNFLPVLILNIIIKIIIFIGFFIISLPIVLSITKQSAAPIDYTYILFFIILIPIILSASFIIKYAIAYVVIKGKGIGESIKNGFQLFIKNWLISLEMAFILFFISFLGWLLILLIILSLTIPFLLLYYIILNIFVGGAILVALLAIIIFIAVVVLTGSIIATFQTISWTKLFLELVGRGGTSKILRVVENIKQKIVN